MLISGLILTIDGGAETFARLEKLLRAKSEITVGELDGIHLPVATEAEGPRHAEKIQNWLGTLPGVRQVDVVAVQFDGEEQAEYDGRVEQSERRPAVIPRHRSADVQSAVSRNCIPPTVDTSDIGGTSSTPCRLQIGDWLARSRSLGPSGVVLATLSQPLSPLPQRLKSADYKSALQNQRLTETVSSSKEILP
jgi:hypothetical protein